MQANIRRIERQHQILKIESKLINSLHRKLGVIFAIDLDIEMKRYGSLRDALFSFYGKRCLFKTAEIPFTSLLPFNNRQRIAEDIRSH